LVFGSLLFLGSLMLIDAVPQYTLLHGKLKEWTDPTLDVTGLWQGSWDLFAPTPNHVNVRIGAQLVWKDEPESTWFQPDRHEMSPWSKAINFRRMSYFDGLSNGTHDLALGPFCRYLLAEQERETGGKLVSVTLFSERDEIPYPTEEWRPVGSPPRYSDRADLYTCTADD
jgi:hypothetical protein